MKKKILIHSIVFSPDGVSTAYLYNDIALKFVDSDYEVLVLTTTPHYNVLENELVKQPMTSKWGGIYYESKYHNIRVIHVPQKKFKSFFLRSLGFLYWHFLSFILGLMEKDISLILSPSPPLTIGVLNIIIGKMKGAKVIYNVQEIYPDFLINQGSLKFGPLVSLLKRMEQFVYNKSDGVTTIDSVFYKTIAPRFKDPSKLHIIPNFVDTALFRPVLPEDLQLNSTFFPEKDNVLKIMYAGNIGHAQDWEPLIFIAKKLLDFKIEFWVIGEGVMKDYLENEIKVNNLPNIHLVPYQKRELMPSLISYADIHFIFMSPQMEGQGFPSKVYTIMACAKPLLVISGAKTPIYNFLKSADCAFLIAGASFDEKCEEIVDLLKKISLDNSHMKELGNNGYQLIENKYSKNAVTKQYVALADQILEG
ncbi:Glycosyltransferase involved in cell wall bisynthesis [Pedobacter steynii]|uniref:Glycosyltransferase involved in cell wall bisynthesis n=1 Tax=Pedobacter steynii TaxID=430522 RepID=A0A1G9WK84_9SPHI|nr:glycosyltransferase family 4 protein [Pedobacter steynii]NQX40314.1 glycosyltransferase family 4 protein [Pedobacter steynii]SDM84581.1 Glycosyltransferase involved in cell wall bisynthesis [Pedobacter steynii]